MTDDGDAPTLLDSLASTAAGRSTPPAPDPRYALRGLLGRGGMGEVWLAHDLRIQRDVAIKWMRGEGARDPDSVMRFLREARVQGRLEHPAIVPVHDIGGGEDAPYFVMKRLAGTTLADVLVEGDAQRWTRRTLLARLVDVCLAVELAHSRGVIHRDLKPANIMLGDLGETYVLDWGLAREGNTPDAVTPLAGAVDGGQTAVGAMMGTPGYMAPEQMRGERVDHRADVFALGCILFEILAGAPAIARDTVFETTLSAPCYRPRERRGDAEVPPELDDLCAAATAAAPADRLASAKALADGIQRFLDGDRDLARRRELAAEHARAAGALFAAGGEAARAGAMREAGRAIALDTTNADAQRLLGRLLLEPPREMPAEARAEIERDRLLASRAVLHKGAIGYGWNLVLLGSLKVLGVSGTWPFYGLGTLLVAAIATCWVASRRAEALSRREVAAFVVLHSMMLAMVAIIGSPLLIGALLAFGGLQILLMYPGAHMPRFIVLAHFVAIGVPFVLEMIGVLPATFELVANGLLVRPWAVGVPAGVLLAVVLAVIFLGMVLNALISTSQRQAQEAAEERVHVQSWHLRQLVR
ncbi:MAG TPA: serine/threonine-protein kinase [Kofleriaceae bacterium]|nr:serine/threonine-protein kinase [Kofleriaceae bacterium]